MKKLPNIHPGEVLLEEFLKPLDISQNKLARAMGVPPRRINEIVHGKRAVTADTAIRLARALGTSEQFWMGLQADYDLEEARKAAQSALTEVVNIAAQFETVAAPQCDVWVAKSTLVKAIPSTKNPINESR